MSSKIYIHLLSALVLSLSSCSQGNNDSPISPEPLPDSDPKPTSKLEIKINPSFDDTRVTDYGFEQNDQIGLFVVNYEGDAPGLLLNTGNHVDNICFTYTGEWNPDAPIYWKDDITHADMYLYYPYTQVTSVNALSFNVKENQSTEADYRSSEFIYGKAENVAPTSEVTHISGRHIMSHISIALKAGNGFTKESLEESDVSVKINDIQTASIIDLATGMVTAAGSRKEITPWLDHDVYKALLVPQTVADGDLITVTVDGRDFKLKKGFTFESGKNHNFTITLQKTSNGINVDIIPWDDDNVDNGGVAE